MAMVFMKLHLYNVSPMNAIISGLCPLPSPKATYATIMVFVTENVIQLNCPTIHIVRSPLDSATQASLYILSFEL